MIEVFNAINGDTITIVENISEAIRICTAYEETHNQIADYDVF